jgi:UbiD family decarboxylase
MADFGVNELEIAGGLRDRAVQVVQCETCDIRVPAHAEMIIEGEIPLDAMEPEGPYGELYGFLGPQRDQNFFMNITSVSHRANPWIQNSFTGLTIDMPKAPQTAAEFNRYKQLIPNLTGFYTPKGTIGVTFIKIKKRFPGEGMSAGQYVSSNPGQNKIVVVLDDDVDMFNPVKVLHALGSRWQPGSASLIVPQTQMMVPDPSKPQTFMSSKIVIDATRQLPAEGGPEKFAPVSRQLLTEALPELFGDTDRKWADIFAKWGG